MNPLKNGKKTKMAEFAVVEGEESIVEYVGQYKTACLSKNALLKNTRDRLEKDKATGHGETCPHHSYWFVSDVFFCLWVKNIFLQCLHDVFLSIITLKLGKDKT